MGMMYLAQDSGAITWAQAIIVRDKDTFELNGIDKPPVHKFNPFATERGAIIGVYCIVKTADGDYLTHAMPISTVEAIRNRSQSWKAGKSTPWKSDPEEMIKKTCVKQASKYWPERARLSAAVHHMDTDGGEGLDFADGNMPVNELQDLLISIREAESVEKLVAARKIAYSEVEKFQDADAKKQLTAAVNKRYAEVKPTEEVKSNG
jgi:recombination protein RecT